MRFCSSKLKPVITNFVLDGNKIPLINSKLKGIEFTFNIRYISTSSNIKAKGFINVKSNEVKFDIDPSSDYDGSLVSYGQMVEVFEHFKPHIELRCNDPICGMDYYCCSNIFQCERPEKEWGGAYYNYSSYTRIKPFLMYFESCDVGKYWVQNDHIYDVTRIISRMNPDMDPIETQLISFGSIPKEKLKSKIKTIVTFS